jgi:glucose-6-phosphate 1-epimerase
MPAATLDELNCRHGIPGRLAFEAGPGGLPVATIRNDHATASVCLAGGHVLTFQPHGHEPVLWLSAQSRYEIGKSVRGGIPVCWPWFSAHPEDATKPFHGFARLMLWSVLGGETAEGGAIRVRLFLSDSAETRALWPHTFALEIAVTVGRELQVELTSRNPGPEPWTCTAALHTYLSVGGVAQIAVQGLDGCRYVEDKAAGVQIQRGPVTFDREVDRLYSGTTATCAVEDPVLKRRIRIAKAGSRSTVVWNPWIDKSRRMPDFGDEEYHGMVCVETANAGEDVITVPPGGSHSLKAVISVEAMG